MYSCISMVATVAFQTLDNEKTALGGLFFFSEKDADRCARVLRCGNQKPHRTVN